MTICEAAADPTAKPRLFVRIIAVDVLKIGFAENDVLPYSLEGVNFQCEEGRFVWSIYICNISCV